MSTEKLDIKQTLVEGVQLGISNFVPLLLTVLLYVVTFWIPYLNVGTTIGMYRVIIKMSKGETVEPGSIFAKENFENLGNFFLLMGLMSIGVSAAMAFMFIPAIVIGIAWGFAMYLFLDKNLSPLKALSLSYKVTYGEKWTIFLIELIAALAVCIIAVILGLIPKVGPFLTFVAVLLCAAILVAIEALLYRHFSAKADELLEKPAE